MSCVLPVTMSKLEGIVEVVDVMFSVPVEGGDWRAGALVTNHFLRRLPGRKSPPWGAHG